MSTSIFMSYPTADLDRSKAFYTALGATINPLFTDENAACLVWEENIYFMVLKREFFATFTDKQVADPATIAQGGCRHGDRGGSGSRWFRTRNPPGPRFHVQP